MHLIEAYAAQCGLQIDRPVIEESYYPVPSEPYFVIHTGTGQLVKNYPFWASVLKLIAVAYFKLNKKPPVFVQIGEGKDLYLRGAVNLLGQTSMRQSAFVIRNSIGLVSGDTCTMHMASAFGIPLVALMSVSPDENSGPYWNRHLCRVLSPDFSVIKPSYSFSESPPRIREILPEHVATNMLDI
jgi:hypothetical protein